MCIALSSIELDELSNNSIELSMILMKMVRKISLEELVKKSGLRILDSAKTLGLGSKDYILMTI